MSSEKVQGGVTGGVEELYREVILDHFKTPKNRGVLPNANAKADGTNPLCGDQISISVLIENQRIKDVRFEGHGCAISQSAASMMTEQAKGKSLDDLKILIHDYKAMLGVNEDKTSKKNPLDEEKLGDLVALEGVKKYPVRIKCALLSANTLIQAAEEFTKQ